MSLLREDYETDRMCWGLIINIEDEAYHAVLMQEQVPAIKSE